MNDLGGLIVALAGTATGAQVALALALMSALMHAIFGALQKGRHDPWLSRGAIDLCILLIALPVGLWAVPHPQGAEWLILIGAAGIQLTYKVAMALAYSRAAFSVVYPVTRGMGPLATGVFAGLFLAEHFNLWQWVGVLMLSGAILGLSALNLRAEQLAPRVVRHGLIWAVAAGILVAVYTTYSAWGIRQTANPFTYLVWFFVMTALDMPMVLAVRAWRGGLPPVMPLALRGLAGALLAFASFGGVMLACRLVPVGQAAVLRETSSVFAALIGWAFLGDTVGPVRMVAVVLIALGAVIVQIAA